MICFHCYKVRAGFNPTAHLTVGWGDKCTCPDYIYHRTDEDREI